MSARLALAALLAGAGPAAAASDLEPYQVVRSLQLVQDDIAGGDHAALPMQRKLLAMIDEKLRTAPKEVFAEARNFRALLIYGISGGNPLTVDLVLSRLGDEMRNPVLAEGVLGYLRGDTASAMNALAAIDPLEQEAELGAFMALVKGTVVSGQDAAAGLHYLDQARLLGPGTLVEESALRRSIALSAAVGDAPRFLNLSGQYVRRFVDSPYASQFADAFVQGAVALDSALDHTALAAIIDGMTPDRREFIYLRLARLGTIEGRTELSAFAAAKAAELTAASEAPDPRAVLYSSIASVATESVEEIAAKLKAIDREKLPDSDRRLLDAATTVAAEVLAAPSVEAKFAGFKTDQAASDAAAPAAAEADPVNLIVNDTRRKLEAIDKLLRETPQ